MDKREKEKRCLAHLATLNIIVFPVKTSIAEIQSGRASILTYGSGFFIKHRDYNFFVTADHVSRYSYWEEGGDGECNTIMIPHNHRDPNGRLGSDFSIKGDFISYDENIEKYKDEFFPIDISFCVINEADLVTDFSVQELIVGNEVICKKGECHIFFEDCDISCFSKESHYFLGGLSECKLEGPMIKQYPNFYDDLTLECVDSDGNVILRGESLSAEKMGGLSGAPILDSKGLLAGLFVRVLEDENKIVAVPMSSVVRYVDYYIDAMIIDENI